WIEVGHPRRGFVVWHGNVDQAPARVETALHVPLHPFPVVARAFETRWVAVLRAERGERKTVEVGRIVLDVRRKRWEDAVRDAATNEPMLPPDAPDPPVRLTDLPWFTSAPVEAGELALGVHKLQ